MNTTVLGAAPVEEVVRVQVEGEHVVRVSDGLDVAAGLGVALGVPPQHAAAFRPLLATA